MEKASIGSKNLPWTVESKKNLSANNDRIIPILYTEKYVKYASLYSKVRKIVPDWKGDEKQAILRNTKFCLRSLKAENPQMKLNAGAKTRAQKFGQQQPVRLKMKEWRGGSRLSQMFLWSRGSSWGFYHRQIEDGVSISTLVICIDSEF